MKEIVENYKPYLRWAGGKRWLIKRIDEFLPTKFRNYHEPFLGGASIFINLKSRGLISEKAYLSDFNSDLIITYNQIQCDVESVISVLTQYKNTSEDYYVIRSMVPNNDIEIAAKFIYLNKTSYNGIYRVNRNGQYNVPYGNRKSENLFDLENLRNLNKLFDNNTIFTHSDFDNIRNTIQAGDLIFLDPPYTVAHENNGFIQYNQAIFSWEDQNRLAALLKHINKVGAFFIMTNAAHFSIAELFNNLGTRFVVSRQSTIGGKGATRQNVNEYIYTNIQHNK